MSFVFSSALEALHIRFNHIVLRNIERHVTIIRLFPYECRFTGRQLGFTGGLAQGGEKVLSLLTYPSVHKRVVMALRYRGEEQLRTYKNRRKSAVPLHILTSFYGMLTITLACSTYYVPLPKMVTSFPIFSLWPRNSDKKCL
jgi:hypothetical protein